VHLSSDDVDNVGSLRCRALLECYIGSGEKITGPADSAVNVLQYVQKNAPQYYKQVFSLIVSLTWHNSELWVMPCFCFFCFFYQFLQIYSNWVFVHAIRINIDIFVWQA